MISFRSFNIDSHLFRLQLSWHECSGEVRLWGSRGVSLDMCRTRWPLFAVVSQNLNQNLTANARTEWSDLTLSVRSVVNELFQGRPDIPIWL
eukprot:6403277-Amphidinium_carterae.2